MRKPIIAGNWKMHKTGAQAVALVQELAKMISSDLAVDVVVCPPFTALYPVKALLGRTIKLGAQNLYWEEQGAFTGEISVSMLADAGCSYVIIGHSERRQFFGETDAGVNKKLKVALAGQLIPILCVGETLAEKEAEATYSRITSQVELALAGLSALEVAGMVIAYEPIWAIGTGRTATALDANSVCVLIRQVVGRLFDQVTAGAVRIQYGGSVKPDNIAELMDQTDIDGVLVGGASLEAATFARIVHY